MAHMVRAEFEGDVQMFTAEIPAAVGDLVDLVHSKFDGQFKVASRRLEYSSAGSQVEVLILKRDIPFSPTSGTAADLLG